MDNDLIGMVSGFFVGCDPVGAVYSSSTEKYSVGGEALQNRHLPEGAEITESYKTLKTIGTGLGLLANVSTGCLPQIIAGAYDIYVNKRDSAS